METKEIVCTCPKKDCFRHLKCEECRKYHYDLGGLPHCERPEQSS